jgi:4-amino-4-deoxy-L-arabinose transferase-like glycosyltransferase
MALRAPLDLLESDRGQAKNRLRTGAALGLILKIRCPVGFVLPVPPFGFILPEPISGHLLTLGSFCQITASLASRPETPSLQHFVGRARVARNDQI